MNILLWILQVLLAAWNIIGGVYTFSNYENLKSTWASDIPKAIWIALCVLQILLALCLVLPGALGIVPKLTPIAAVFLAANALLGCALFAQYAGFPGMLWGVLPALLVAFVAYGRITGL